jgi:hypothetical protein
MSFESRCIIHSCAFYLLYFVFCRPLCIFLLNHTCIVLSWHCPCVVILIFSLQFRLFVQPYILIVVHLGARIWSWFLDDYVMLEACHTSVTDSPGTALSVRAVQLSDSRNKFSVLTVWCLLLSVCLVLRNGYAEDKTRNVCIVWHLRRLWGNSSWRFFNLVF